MINSGRSFSTTPPGTISPRVGGSDRACRLCAFSVGTACLFAFPSRVAAANGRRDPFNRCCPLRLALYLRFVRFNRTPGRRGGLIARRGLASIVQRFAVPPDRRPPGSSHRSPWPRRRPTIRAVPPDRRSPGSSPGSPRLRRRSTIRLAASQSLLPPIPVARPGSGPRPRQPAVPLRAAANSTESWNIALCIRS